MDDAAQLELTLRRLRARLMARRALGWAVRAGWIAAAAAAACALAGFFLPGAAALSAGFVVAIPAVAGAAAIAAALRRPGLADCAVWLDRACGLEDRVSTAWECAGSQRTVETRHGASLHGTLDDILLHDALAALDRGDWARMTRLGVPREAPVLGAAMAALAILMAVPGRPSAGPEGGADAAVLRRAARRLEAAALAPAPQGGGAFPAGPPDAALAAIEQEVRRTVEALRDGGLSPEDARERLRSLAREIELKRAERPAGASDAPARWLEDVLEAVRDADLLAGDAAGAGSGGPATGPVDARSAVLDESLRRGFTPSTRLGASRPSDGTPAGIATGDFASAFAPLASSPAPGDAPAAAAPPPDLAAFLSDRRRALAERRWPRSRYDEVVNRYFGLDEGVSQKN